MVRRTDFETEGTRRPGLRKGLWLIGFACLAAVVLLLQNGWVHSGSDMGEQRPVADRAEMRFAVERLPGIVIPSLDGMEITRETNYLNLGPYGPEGYAMGWYTTAAGMRVHYSLDCSKYKPYPVEASAPEAPDPEPQLSLFEKSGILRVCFQKSGWVYSIWARVDGLGSSQTARDAAIASLREQFQTILDQITTAGQA